MWSVCYDLDMCVALVGLYVGLSIVLDQQKNEVGQPSPGPYTPSYSNRWHLLAEHNYQNLSF